jgi:hypothetical protein
MLPLTALAAAVWSLSRPTTGFYFHILTPSPLRLAAAGLLVVWFAELAAFLIKHRRDSRILTRIRRRQCPRCDYPVERAAGRCSECGMRRTDYASFLSGTGSLASMLARALSIAAFTTLIGHAVVPMQYQWWDNFTYTLNPPNVTLSPYVISKRVRLDSDLRLLETTGIRADSDHIREAAVYSIVEFQTGRQLVVELRQLDGRTTTVPEGFTLPDDLDRYAEHVAEHSGMTTFTTKDAAKSILDLIRHEYRFQLEVHSMRANLLSPPNPPTAPGMPFITSMSMTVRVSLAPMSIVLLVGFAAAIFTLTLVFLVVTTRRRGARLSRRAVSMHRGEDHLEG